MRTLNEDGGGETVEGGNAAPTASILMVPIGASGEFF